MKKHFNLFLIIALIAIIACTFIACDDGGDGNEDDFVDYVSALKLDMNSDTNKRVVEVRTYIDGDTTHFVDPDNSMSDNGVIKARYLAVNTPESTGRIEEYGKKASEFTRSKLESATSILIESNDSNWNFDSTGSRYLLWIWYKTSEDADYRNLNIELLQNGYAMGSNIIQTRYAEVAKNALYQAEVKKLNMYSGVKDDDVYVGDPVDVTLKELVTNLLMYDREDENSLYNLKVGFDAIVTKNNKNNSIYVESLEEDGQCYGMTCFLGYDQISFGVEALEVGNRVRIVGSVQYYEGGDSFQISDMTYNARNPQDPNTYRQLDDEKHDPYYQTVDFKKLNNGSKVDVEVVVNEQKETKQFTYAELVLNTSVKAEHLVVTKIYTTKTGDNKGAMTLTCTTSDGTTVYVRTNVFIHDGKTVTEDAYKGKTITVDGVIGKYTPEGGSTQYQICVFDYNDILVEN